MRPTSPRLTRTATLATCALATAAIGVTALPQAASANVSRTARVVRVIDGDQLVLTSVAGPRRYRLLGVRAPGLEDCFGRQSRARLRSLLPAGTKVRVIARRAGAHSVVVLRRGAGVNRLVVQSGHAEASGAVGSQLGRILAAAQRRAETEGRGLWSACATDDGTTATGETEAPAERPAPDASEETPAPKPAPKPAPPAGQTTRQSQAQFQAFIENSVFTRASSSSTFGGSNDRNDFTFCPGGLYTFHDESFNNGFSSTSNESGSWKITSIARRADIQADEARLELVTQDSDASDFDPSSSEAQRTFPVTITSFDDGRVAVGSSPAQRAASSCG